MSAVVAFSAASYSVPEHAGSATITVNRLGSTSVASVNYATANGTATTGTDYTAVTGTLTWADGDATPKTFTVPILDPGVSDGSTRTLASNLTVPQFGTSVGAGNTATLNITEDGAAPTPTPPPIPTPTPAPTIAPTPIAAPVISNATSVSVQAGVVFSLQIVASNAPTSYSAPGLPAGLSLDPSTGLIADAPALAAGSYPITLSATNAGGTGTAILTLTITVPEVSVVALGAKELIGDHAGKGKVAVRRTGSTSIPLTVHYKVRGSALSGVDYKITTGTVTIPVGATQTKIKLKPLEDMFAGTRIAKVKLKAASDGS